MISSTFGAPLGGTIFAGRHGLESVALRLMTPPKAGGGDGTYLPSMVVVVLVEHGTPVVCWALEVIVADSKSRNNPTSRSRPWVCKNFFEYPMKITPPIAERASTCRQVGWWTVRLQACSIQLLKVTVSGL